MHIQNLSEANGRIYPDSRLQKKLTVFLHQRKKLTFFNYKQENGLLFQKFFHQYIQLLTIHNLVSNILTYKTMLV